MESPDFEKLCTDVLNFVNGTGEHFTIKYLKDVSLILSLVSAVREGNFERHLQAEKEKAKSISQEEAFNHPLTGLPLSIATCDGKLYQSDKSQYRNLLIKDSLSTTIEKPMNCAWFVGGMASIRTLNPAATYKDFADSLVTFLSSLTANCSPTVVGLINDCYLEKSTKDCTRSGRGEAGANVKINSINQAMLTGMRWKEFLHNSRNKEELLNILTRYFQSENARTNLPFPMIINNKYQTTHISSTEVSEMFSCNHKEADYRIVLHALLCTRKMLL